MKKLISVVMALALLLAMAVTTPVAAASTEIYDVYAGESIQEAVNAASSGDTVVVHKGEYHESVKIIKDDITLKGVGKVILDGTDVDPVSLGDKLAILGIWIASDVTGVTITGFDIRNYGVWEELPSEPFVIIEELGIGIWLESGSNHNIVERNKLSNCLFGIMASTSDDNIIEGNELSDGINGIGVERAGHRNKVINNKITNCLGGIGIDEGSTFNIIEKNNIAKSSIVGIVIDGNVENGDSSHNKVMENIVTNSGERGIWLGARSSDNLVRENRVFGSGMYDLYNDDLSTGNIWEENKYKTSYPDPLP